jgi:hypothetical protein
MAGELVLRGVDVLDADGQHAQPLLGEFLIAFGVALAGRVVEGHLGDPWCRARRAATSSAPFSASTTRANSVGSPITSPGPCTMASVHSAMPTRVVDLLSPSRAMHRP